MERRLFEAADCNDVATVKHILQEHPKVNLGWINKHYNRYTVANQVCYRGHDKILALLLAHPGVNVNMTKPNGVSPFAEACIHCQLSCALLLLRDPLTNLHLMDNQGHTPLVWAVSNGFVEFLQWWIASGREMNLGVSNAPKSDQILLARELDQGGWGEKISKKAEGIALLERFRDDPEAVRFEMRVKLGWLDDTAADHFALIVFLCDGLLRIREKDGSGAVLPFRAVWPSSPAARFFKIASRLPLELQMVLCYQVVGARSLNIPGEHRERAFRSLARVLSLGG